MTLSVVVVRCPTQSRSRGAAVKNIRLEKNFTNMYNKEFECLDSLKLGDSQEDRERKLLVDKGCKRNADGSYEVPLPLRSLTNVPANAAIARERLHGVKMRLTRDPKYRSTYTAFMEDLISKGWIERAPEGSLAGGWYIPHFGVFSEKKNKIRVVLDCAARVQGMSLNDLLYPGPNLANSLVSVLIQFRQGIFAFTADVNAMYYQVKVPVAMDFFITWTLNSENGENYWGPKSKNPLKNKLLWISG